MLYLTFELESNRTKLKCDRVKEGPTDPYSLVSIFLSCLSPIGRNVTPLEHIVKKNVPHHQACELGCNVRFLACVIKFIKPCGGGSIRPWRVNPTPWRVNPTPEGQPDTFWRVIPTMPKYWTVCAFWCICSLLRKHYFQDESISMSNVLVTIVPVVKWQLGRVGENVPLCPFTA